jgi:hypothetical protein
MISIRRHACRYRKKISQAARLPLQEKDFAGGTPAATDWLSYALRKRTDRINRRR